MKKSPVFQIGDIVNCPTTLYHETRGEIIEKSELWKPIDVKGAFKSRSVNVDIKGLSYFNCSYIFVDDKLIITFASGTVENYKFFDHTYIVQTPKIRTGFPEKMLIRLNK